MTGFKTKVFPPESFARAAARRISSELNDARSAVLTGGTTAARIYAELGDEVRWGGAEILFSDERCVPPTDPASNYGMAERLLFDRSTPRLLHRMKGEDPPDEAADSYDEEIRPVVERGIDLILLGMGADAHVGALFPGSMALDQTAQLCAAVDRPDGMTGLTLTPPALLSGTKVLVLVAGHDKAPTVRRVVRGDETVAACPARLLVQHPDVTFLLDERAASAL